MMVSWFETIAWKILTTRTAFVAVEFAGPECEIRADGVGVEIGEPVDEEGGEGMENVGTVSGVGGRGGGLGGGG